MPNRSSNTAVLKTAPRVGAGATYWFQVYPAVKFSFPDGCTVGEGNAELDAELGGAGREKVLTVQFSTCRVI